MTQGKNIEGRQNSYSGKKKRTNLGRIKLNHSIMTWIEGKGRSMMPSWFPPEFREKLRSSTSAQPITPSWKCGGGDRKSPKLTTAIDAIGIPTLPFTAGLSHLPSGFSLFFKKTSLSCLFHPWLLTPSCPTSTYALTVSSDCNLPICLHATVG